MKTLSIGVQIELGKLLKDMVAAEPEDFRILQHRAQELVRRIEREYEAQS